jgi:hypothetical protein
MCVCDCSLPPGFIATQLDVKGRAATLNYVDPKGPYATSAKVVDFIMHTHGIKVCVSYVHSARLHVVVRLCMQCACMWAHHHMNTLCLDSSTSTVHRLPLLTNAMSHFVCRTARPPMNLRVVSWIRR